MFEHIPFENAKIVIFDWNGTLFRLPTSEGENIAIAKAVVKHQLSKGLSEPLKTLKLLARFRKARVQLRNMISQYHDGKLPLEKVFAHFNHVFVRDTPYAVVRKAMQDFSAAQGKNVVNSTVNLLKESQRRGLRTAILSVAAEEVISDCLKENNLSVDAIYANKLEHTGKIATGISLDIYGRKAEVLRSQIIRDFKVSPEKILYCGDSDDDLPIARIIPKGNFIVPSCAIEDFRDRMIAEFTATPLEKLS